jgi:aminoglycoside 3-N-acetyltransferase
VGKHGDDLVREYSLEDPLVPLNQFLRQDPRVLTIGVTLDAVTAIHVAEQLRVPSKFVKERALTVSSKGQTWVDVVALGCSNGFEKLRPYLGSKNFRDTSIGLAKAEVYSMGQLIEAAKLLLEKDSTSLSCDNAACLSCPTVPRGR